MKKPAQLISVNSWSILQIDLEEAKGQEIAKFQNTLHELQEQLDEANAAIIREKEAAKLAIEQAPPVIKEVPIIDNSKVEQLSEQNDKLQVTKAINSLHIPYQETGTLSFANREF